jgi:hypothetical protein
LTGATLHQVFRKLQLKVAGIYENIFLTNDSSNWAQAFFWTEPCIKAIGQVKFSTRSAAAFKFSSLILLLSDKLG